MKCSHGGTRCAAKDCPNPEYKHTTAVVQASTGKHKYRTLYMCDDNPESIAEAVEDVRKRVKPGSKIRAVRVHHYDIREVIGEPIAV